MSGTQDEERWSKLAQLETVVDIGGCCHWCDDPLEPGQVIVRADNGQRIHEDACLADAQLATATAA